MAYYDAYRNGAGWGTAGYKFSSPLVPAYQPQPSWRGVDYYRAHGGYTDPDIYNYTWSRVRDRAAVGYGKEEARLWHRRVYGGLMDIRSLLPEDIGAAAGYEAWRSWKYHHGVYAQPLSGDRDREREAMIGIAVAEAHRLWKYTGQRSDSFGRLKACEAAGSTAVRILEHSFYGSGGYYDDARGRSLSRRSSRSSIASFIGDVFSRSRSRSRSRHSPILTSNSYMAASPTLSSASIGYAADPSYGYAGSGRRRAYSNASASPYLGTTPAIYGSGTTLSAAPYVPQYAGSGGSGPITIIQPSRSSRSRSRHRHDHGHGHHRSGSRHRSSSRHRPHHGHAHSASYSGGGYYVSSGVPYGY